MSDIYDMLENGQRQKSQRYTIEEYKQLKKEEKNQVFQIANEQLEQVLGSQEQFQRYLDIQSRMDRYSATNVLLIMRQRPDTSQLKDYEGWLQAGTRVNRGEKSITILEPYAYQKSDGSTGTGYNVKKVFDISQTSMPNILKKERPTQQQVLKALVRSAPVPVKADDGENCQGKNIHYDEGSMTVYIRRGLTADEFFNSLSETLANVRLDNGAADSKYQDVGKTVTYMLARAFDFPCDRIKIPQLYQQLDQKEVRKELNRARTIFSQMKSECYLEVDLDRQALRKAGKVKDER